MAVGFAPRLVRCGGTVPFSPCLRPSRWGKQGQRSVFRLGCGGDDEGRSLRSGWLSEGRRAQCAVAGKSPGLKSDPHKLFCSAFFCLFYPSQNAALRMLNAGTGQHSVILLGRCSGPQEFVCSECVPRGKPCSSLLAQGRALAIPGLQGADAGALSCLLQACHLSLSSLCANKCTGLGWVLLSDIPKTLTKVAVRKHCPSAAFYPGVRSFRFSVTTSACSGCA